MDLAQRRAHLHRIPAADREKAASAQTTQRTDVAMAVKLNSAHTCERCAKPVKPGSDFLRAHFFGQTAYWHWRCFTELMRASEEE
jgi:hypothetical protein